MAVASPMEVAAPRTAESRPLVVPQPARVEAKIAKQRRPAAMGHNAHSTTRRQFVTD
jgi:hypothetical protein